MDLDALTHFVSSTLEELAVPADAAPMAAYMKTDMPFWGVKKPARVVVERALRDRFRPTTREDLEAATAALWAMPHREEKYLALSHARRFHMLLTPESLPLLERHVREGAWWDFVDDIAGNLVGSLWRRFPEVIAPAMDRWIEDDDLWIRRTAILGQLKSKEATDSARLFAYCAACMHEREFFIRKAIGWALRSYGDTTPGPVSEFLLTHRGDLSGLSFREGSRKLVKSGLLVLPA